MGLVFVKATDLEPGLVYSLLSRSWADIWNDELATKIREFDRDVYANPGTVGSCTYITTVDGRPAGMFSWDPRQHPEAAVVGWNCVLPEYRGKGIGSRQILEMLRRFRKAGFRKAVVTTSEHPFFLAAQQMYPACGFVEVRRYSDSRDPRHASIDYEIALGHDNRV